MLKSLALASALLCALTVNSEARQHHPPACIETGPVMVPACTGKDNNPFSGAVSIKVTMHRERHAANPRPRLSRQEVVYANPMQSFGSRIARPMRYIGGRLICAVNVNAALAERGIRGTGSALAHSFDHWGIRVLSPIAGAVAVTDRRGGGHVALVSRVEGSRVFVWNPSPHGRGWQEMEYTNRHARYRVAG